MILNFFFRQFSTEKQVNYLQKNGVSLGTRVKNGRKIYVYMLRGLFVEVLYKMTTHSKTPEKVNMLKRTEKPQHTSRKRIQSQLLSWFFFARQTLLSACIISENQKRCFFFIPLFL